MADNNLDSIVISEKQEKQSDQQTKLCAEQESPQAIIPTGYEGGLYSPLPLAPVYYSKPINAIASARTRGQADPISQTMTIGEVTFSFPNGASSCGVAAHKLLMVALSAFTSMNTARQTNPSLEVAINFMEYAELCGEEVRPKAKPTQALREKEAKRIENNIRNLQKKLRSACKSLLGASANWTENYNGKEYRYSGMTFIGAYEITRDYIRIEFTLSAAKHLVSHPIVSQYPSSMLAIAERNPPNAYAIAICLISHYFLDRNVKAGTHNLLRIENILAHTRLPSVEELKATSHSSEWPERVMDRFEACMNELVRAGVVAPGWYYSSSKGKKLTEAEVNNLTSYEGWLKLCLCYEIAQAPSREERLVDIQARREKANKKRSSAANKRHKKKPKNPTTT